MQATDLGRKRGSLPETPPDREWLRVAGAAIALGLICAIWTFWS
jgi:hypothetical protein